MFHGYLKYKTHKVWVYTLVALEPHENSELNTILTQRFLQEFKTASFKNILKQIFPLKKYLD